MANSEGGFQTSRWFYLTLAIFSFGVIIACFVSNAFVNTSSAYVNMDVQPADFCFFAIWAILYIFQVCLLAYGAIYLFRKDSENVLIFKKINHIHYTFYLLMTLSYIADIIWSWTNWSPIGNFITLFFMAMPQWIIFTISMYALDKQLDSMKQFDMRPDIVLIRLLIQNGCAAWATWYTIGFVMGFANLLTNCGGVDGTVASTISLSFILTLLVVYFILDLIIYTTLFIFQYTTYLTVTWTFIGVLAKNVASTVGLTRNNIISIVILCTALVLLFIKLVIPLIFFDKIKPSTADPRVPRSATAKRRRAQQQQGTNTAGPSREPTGVWHY